MIPSFISRGAFVVLLLAVKVLGVAPRADTGMAIFLGATAVCFVGLFSVVSFGSVSTAGAARKRPTCFGGAIAST